MRSRKVEYEISFCGSGCPHHKSVGACTHPEHGDMAQVTLVRTGEAFPRGCPLKLVFDIVDTENVESIEYEFDKQLTLSIIDRLNEELESEGYDIHRRPTRINFSSKRALELGYWMFRSDHEK